MPLAISLHQRSSLGKRLCNFKFFLDFRVSWMSINSCSPNLSVCNSSLSDPFSQSSRTIPKNPANGSLIISYDLYLTTLVSMLKHAFLLPLKHSPSMFTCINIWQTLSSKSSGVLKVFNSLRSTFFSSSCFVFDTFTATDVVS